MDCRVNLTNRDINNIIAVLYLQTYLEDEDALALIDKLNDELDACITEQSGSRVEHSPEYVQARQQLTRQLYFQHRHPESDA
ncbi:hypothetical protein HRE53_24935 [Acaryochloris sp. 'Moss Beach']|uniref:hypothetical protein n=1 Tax=Acaryochloris TaxID=155977 RepID=UPI001BAE698C|nr:MULTISPECIES: hypothetical protein [Acaryochloris]QUY44866.1 hypothetical protein I1H34_12760 [Acaryochloris marina S15]UJB69536.1 hypothetical protein HRE53_24935 [Acaryochloris sp. 'Moss Beach']